MPTVDVFPDPVLDELLSFFNVNIHTLPFHDSGFHGQASLPHYFLKD